MLSIEEIHSFSLEILKKFVKICDEQNLEYSLAYGTLLGAVRHKGFIPWDDDLDVFMPRKDYEQFVEYCLNNGELYSLELFHYKTSKEYIYPIARLSDPRFRTEYRNVKDYGLGVFIDIYPLDGFEKDEKYVSRILWKKSIVHMCGNEQYNPSPIVYKNLFKYPVYLFSRLLNINKKIADMDKHAQKYDYDSSTYVTCACWEPNEVYLKEWFSEMLLVDFEDIKVKIPCGFDNILRTDYGDYMKLPPEEKRQGHHFYKVYYKEQ